MSKRDYQHHPTWFFIKQGTQYTCQCDKCEHKRWMSAVPYTYVTPQPNAPSYIPTFDPYIVTTTDGTTCR